MRDIWGKFPFAFEFHIYMFNVTNPYGIESGEKPVVQEVGPFVYDKWHEKVNQIDEEDDDTVSYATKSMYYFNKDKSNGLSDEMEIVIPHFFIFALINAVHRDKPSALPVLSKAIDSIFGKPENLFIKTKVRNILFDGLLVDCNVQDFAGSAVCTQIKIYRETLDIQLVGENLYSASIVRPANGTESKARTRVHRGIKNIMDVGKVIEYNNNRNISVWDDEYCDTFNGTDGTVFHPHFDRKGRDDVVVFNPNLCRSISCHFESKTTFSNMNLLRYTTDLGIDSENNPRQKCYCQPPNKCLKKGTFDTYKCNKSPIIVTNPHFFLADPYYKDLIDGMKPDKEKHMIIIDIDPFTGIPINVHTRAQLNILVNKVEKMKQLNNYREALLPIFWMDEVMIMPEYLLKEIKSGHTMVLLSKIFKYFVMLSGLGMCGFAGIKQYILRNKKKILNVMHAGEQKFNKNFNNAEMKTNINTMSPAVATLPVNIH
ncbi:PREDICTED: sensory neuron membrane protein 1-like [Ceratosolen solmsi marchali]|uniref:Sensory neuron membrane protein 1-like n=1 Tax=Ceratosolen solmsi marchali TaxID=326594 RepID=A0AAJ6YJP6_9HYME|nr:PREDICTED: sensory neuron membrane protein 1-like [Ceratosolen solmsi marchali]